MIGEDDGRGFLHDDREAGAYFEYGWDGVKVEGLMLMVAGGHGSMKGC